MDASSVRHWLRHAGILSACARGQRLEYVIIDFVSQNPHRAIGQQEIRDILVIAPKVKLVRVIEGVPVHQSIPRAA
jgi:hypothetical protein